MDSGLLTLLIVMVIATVIAVVAVVVTLFTGKERRVQAEVTSTSEVV